MCSKIRCDKYCANFFLELNRTSITDKYLRPRIPDAKESMLVPPWIESQLHSRRRWERKSGRAWTPAQCFLPIWWIGSRLGLQQACQWFCYLLVQMAPALWVADLWTLDWLEISYIFFEGFRKLKIFRLGGNVRLDWLAMASWSRSVPSAFWVEGEWNPDRWFLAEFRRGVGELLIVGGIRLLRSDQVASVATRSIGGAGPKAENNGCAFKHLAGVVGIGHRIRRWTRRLPYLARQLSVFRRQVCSGIPLAIWL